MPASEVTEPPLFQPDRGLWIAPVRHHSPACAFAVRAMLCDLRPDRVLIEGPADLAPLIGELLDPEIRPPVAAVMLRGGRSAYAPFCAHSPEYVAMRTAREIGAEISFIDLPSESLFVRSESANGPIPVEDEAPFDQGDYIRALCRRTGCRDGFELWDHLFESRLGDPDWQGFLRDVGVYCAGLRVATAQDEIDRRGDAQRETAMAGHIAAALKTGTVAAIVGGFHAPALTEPTGPTPKVPAMESAYLVRYSHMAMDALAGYGAGLPQPGFYDIIWQAAERAGGTPDWRQLATEMMQAFTAETAANGHLVSLPGKIETLRMAETLAAMRGRCAVLRHDLFDGLQAALTKGEVSSHDPWKERLRRHWRGAALGHVPLGLKAPPLVEDARQRALGHRFDVSDALTRKRTLDLYRKPPHLGASRFLHAMDLLGAGFGTWEAGPDYVSGLGTGRLFEEWSYAWSPAVETRLIQLAANGAGETVAAACLAEITAQKEPGLEARLKLLGRGIRAGLGGELKAIVKAIAQDMSRSGDFAELGCALRQLYGLCHTRGPMRPPEELELSRLLQVGYVRLVYLADDLPHVPAEMTEKAVAAMRLVADLLGSDETASLDRQLFDDAMARLAARTAPPEITGAAMALALRAGQLPEERLAAALEGNFRGAVLETGERIGVLTGMISTAPELLWLCREVLNAVDRFLLSLGENDFLTLLPVLRRAFTTLNPREADRLAEILAERHGGTASGFQVAVPFTKADLAVGLAAQKAMRASLEADGLTREDA